MLDFRQAIAPQFAGFGLLVALSSCSDDKKGSEVVDASLQLIEAGPGDAGGPHDTDAGEARAHDAGTRIDAAMSDAHAPDGGGPSTTYTGRSLNDGPCKKGQTYVQEELTEPVRISPRSGELSTTLVVRIRERCVPVWIPQAGTVEPHWEMQTLNLRTYGYPKSADTVISAEDADSADSDKIAWSAPGPTFVMHPAGQPGAPDGTRFDMRLYNRMPHDDHPGACDVNVKCNTKGANAGRDPETGECRVPPKADAGGSPAQTPGQVLDGGAVVEPPNCFHGNNSTNFHFHGFHVSPQLGQDFVGLELRPPKPDGVTVPDHGSHGEHGVVAYGHFDFAVDPLRFTQPPGTHWYHAHKHGSTALQVLNGLVGTFEVRGEFDEQLSDYFNSEGGGKLEEKLLVVQQLQEKQPGLGGADQTGAVLLNGQANPIVRMRPGQIQRWRFVGATMQASAALNVGFPERDKVDSPEVRQIAMDGVQFSPENYGCQPFLNNADCSPQPDESEFDELTSFALSPGNRVDVLIKAPLTPGTHCVLLDVSTDFRGKASQKVLEGLAERGAAVAGSCGLDASELGPLLTLVIEKDENAEEMTFPTVKQFPKIAPYLVDISAAQAAERKKAVYYQMVNQGDLQGTQFWINQTKYDPQCINETLTLDEPEEWTLRNNSPNISHPFHIHQNPFQLVSQSDRGTYAHPVWRDTLAIPKATAEAGGSTPAPNSDPDDAAAPWGGAVLRYVAKEFTGAFVNHCHILGHEDRGMMHNTQASCADGKWGETGPVPPKAKCDKEGFCPSDCDTGKPIPAGDACAEPPPQMSDWPAAYGVSGN